MDRGVGYYPHYMHEQRSPCSSLLLSFSLLPKSYDQCHVCPTSFKRKHLSPCKAKKSSVFYPVCFQCQE